VFAELYCAVVDGR